MDFRTKNVTETAIYPHLLLFPLPIQRLLLQEYYKMEDRLSDGKSMAHLGEDSISCYCQFFLRYQLPCQHILHSDSLYDILDMKQWERYAERFKGDIGMEVYEDKGEIAVLKEPSEQDGLANRKLKMREIYQHLSTKFFELEEALTNESEHIRVECMDRWLYGLHRATDTFVRHSVVDLLMGECIMVEDKPVEKGPQKMSEGVEGKAEAESMDDGGRNSLDDVNENGVVDVKKP